MDGQLRAYVWAQAVAASLSTNHPADQAAQKADEALAEFDKRTFDTRDSAQVEYLKGQLAEANAEIARRDEEVIAPPAPALDLTLGMELAAEVAAPDFLEKYNQLKTKAAAFDALGSKSSEAPAPAQFAGDDKA